jgi:hypothetical protein
VSLACLANLDNERKGMMGRSESVCTALKPQLKVFVVRSQKSDARTNLVAAAALKVQNIKNVCFSVQKKCCLAADGADC